MLTLETAMLFIGAYLIGSISAAIIVCRLMGLDDPRQGGSGNPGATNVKRLYGNKPAALTLAGDLLKGVIPVVIAAQLGFDDVTVLAIGFAAFIGHLYPVFFGFRGGKGVATMIGVVLAFHFWFGLAVVATWLFVAKVLKISSLSALIAAILAPGYLYLFTENTDLVIIMSVISAALIWRHKSNIQRLLNGEEDLIKKS